MVSRSQQSLSVLIVSTLAFTVCFMVWMMFGVIGIPIKKTLGLNATEFGLLTATPVLTGSLIRVPLGMWTDKYGGRIVMFLLMLATVVPIWLIGYATEYWHFLVLGLFVGLAGGSFSVGTPYVARWFRKHGRASRWASTAPATPARRSTSSSRRRWWWPSAGRWCRRSTPRSCWSRRIAVLDVQLQRPGAPGRRHGSPGASSSRR